MQRLLLLLVCCTFMACGYRVVHAEHLFGNQRIVFVPFSETQPDQFALIFSRVFAKKLAEHGIQTTLSRSEGDAILTGTILSSATGGTPTATGSSVRSYALNVKIEATLTNKQGEVIFKTTLDAIEDFVPPASSPPDALGIEANRRKSIYRVSERLAQELLEQLEMQTLMQEEKPQ